MRLLAALTLALGWFTAWGADLSAVKHVPNFDMVNSYVYRGGQPASVGLDELHSLGIRRVIDLREDGAPERKEAAALSKLGIKYVNIPMKPFSAPSQEDVGSVLAMLLNDGEGPVFVHCRRGKDRTGTVIACYRMQHDGWTNERALAEARAHGMSSLERGMRAFIEHFRPVPNGLAAAAH